MNLCTDQMAMLVAAEGQLHSVSQLARDGSASALAEEARAYVVNHGMAEEVFLMKPDLVIAGTYTTRATVGLLRRLGISVEEFAPETSFDDVRNNLRRMGRILGREARAGELIARLDRRLAELSPDSAGDRSIAPYYANSYTSGEGTLVDAIVSAAGLRNIAAEAGLVGMARLPMELLVMAHPDLLMGEDQTASEGTHVHRNLVHPALDRAVDPAARIIVPARLTTCGGPFTALAVSLLRDAADALDR